MAETRYLLKPEHVDPLRGWLRGLAEHRGERRGEVTAYRPKEDESWMPEHLALHAALLQVMREAHEDEAAGRWTFTEVIHLQDCDESEAEEQMSATFHSRDAARGLLSAYVSLFTWQTHHEVFRLPAAELVLERAEVGDRSQHFLVLRGEDRSTHAGIVAGAPVALTPLLESHVWHVWKLASGDRRAQLRDSSAAE